MNAELVERRILGALRFVDSNTGLPILIPLSVEAAEMHFIRNRENLYVISSASGLEAHTRAFEAPPSAPPLGSLHFSVTITDPSGRYLPRRQTVNLPRDPAADHNAQSDSLFQPIDITLFPSPTASVDPGSAVIRATVFASGTGEPLPGVLIRVLRAADQTLLARGVTVWQGRTLGEALIPVSGIPVTTWGGSDGGEASGSVIVTEIQAVLEAIHDPTFDPKSGALPDPDDLERRRNDLPHSTKNVLLASGRTLTIALSI